MATATNEKNSNASFNPAEMMIDAWVRNLSHVCWAQEQGEKMVRNLMEQNQVTREEGLKVATRFAEAAKVNQRSLQNLVVNSVRMSLEAWRVPQQKMVEELNRRIEEMNAQVEKFAHKN